MFLPGYRNSKNYSPRSKHCASFSLNTFLKYIIALKKVFMFCIHLQNEQLRFLNLIGKFLRESKVAFSKPFKTQRKWTCAGFSTGSSTNDVTQVVGGEVITFVTLCMKVWGGFHKLIYTLCQALTLYAKLSRTLFEE